MELALLIFAVFGCITLVSSSCAIYNSSYSDQAENYTCQCIKTMNFSLDQAYENQPLYYLFLPQCELCLLYDNICQTYAPDGKGNYNVYEVIVYHNSSSTTLSYTAKQESTVGVSVFSAPCLTYTNYLFALIDDKVVTGYRCGDYGESATFAPFVFGIGLTRSLNKSYWEPVADAIAAAGLPVGKYYTLPNRLPTQCVIPEPCQQVDSPIQDEEGGACQAQDSDVCP